MKKNIIVYDIETKFTFDEVGGRGNLDKLGISVLGSFDYMLGEFVIYEESELEKFSERLLSKPLLVGFNSLRFDTPILQKHVPNNLKLFPQLDIMDELQKVLGHRIGLDSVAQATLGAGKSGDGLDAIKYYREGRIDELKKYCLDDVRITRDIFEYGAAHGELFFISKFGSTKTRAAVNWKVEGPIEKVGAGEQLSLF